MIDRLGIDPNKYKPRSYSFIIDVPRNLNGTGQNSLTIDDTPFYLDHITHSLLGVKDGDQDGNYGLKFRDTNQAYNDHYVMATALFGGSYGKQKPLYLPVRTLYDVGTTLYMDALNLQDRFVELLYTFPLEIVFKGYEPWK